MKHFMQSTTVAVLVGCLVSACGPNGLRFGAVAPKPNETTQVGATNSSNPGTAPSTNPTPTSPNSPSSSDAPARVPAGESGSVPAGELTPKQLKRVAELTDEFRKKNGLSPLKWNRRLSAAAQSYAERMSKEDFFDHSAPDGSTPGERISGQGYKWKTWGENIAAGQSLPEKVVEAWIKSSEHRANLLNKDFVEIGVGYAEGSSAQFGDKYPYWVQEFATPIADTGVEEDNEDEEFPDHGGGDQHQQPRPHPRPQEPHKKGQQEGPKMPKPTPKPKPKPSPGPSPSPTPIGQPLPYEEDLS